MYQVNLNRPVCANKPVARATPVRASQNGAFKPKELIASSLVAASVVSNFLCYLNYRFYVLKTQIYLILDTIFLSFVVCINIGVIFYQLNIYVDIFQFQKFWLYFVQEAYASVQFHTERIYARLKVTLAHLKTFFSS